MGEILFKNHDKISDLSNPFYTIITPFMALVFTWNMTLAYQRQEMDFKNDPDLTRCYVVNPIPTNLTLFCWNWVDLKIDPGQPISNKGRVNPIPTNLTLFCWNRVDSKIDPGQPISDKGRVNPIPTNLTLFLLESGWLENWPCPVNPIPTKSTRFQQRKSTQFQQSQPDSDKVLWVNPIPTKVESTRFQQISQPDYS